MVKATCKSNFSKPNKSILKVMKRKYAKETDAVEVYIKGDLEDIKNKMRCLLEDPKKWEEFCAEAENKSKRKSLVSVAIRRQIVEEIRKKPDCSMDNVISLMKKYKIENMNEYQFRSVVRNAEKTVERRKLKSSRREMMFQQLQGEERCSPPTKEANVESMDCMEMVNEVPFLKNEKQSCSPLLETSNNDRRERLVAELNDVVAGVSQSSLNELISIARRMAQTSERRTNDSYLKQQQPTELKLLDLMSDDEESTVEESSSTRPRRFEASSNRKEVSFSKQTSAVFKAPLQKEVRNVKKFVQKQNRSDLDTSRNSLQSNLAQNAVPDINNDFGVPSHLRESWNNVEKVEIETVAGRNKMLHSQPVFFLIYQMVAEHNRENPQNMTGLISINISEEMYREGKKYDKNLRQRLKASTYFGFSGLRFFIMPIFAAKHFSVAFFDLDKQQITHANSLETCNPFSNDRIKKIAVILGVKTNERFSNPSAQQGRRSLSCGIYTILNCEIHLGKETAEWENDNSEDGYIMVKRLEYHQRLLQAVDNRHLQVADRGA